jgi:hypothetical protein
MEEFSKKLPFSKPETEGENMHKKRSKNTYFYTHFSLIFSELNSRLKLLFFNQQICFLSLKAKTFHFPLDFLTSLV